jgi:transcriptional regulator of acetoin/glycerol metabolism
VAAAHAVASVATEAPLGLGEVRRQRLIKALRETGGNQSEAARRLGISRTSVWSQMKRFNLDSKGDPGK